MRRKPLLHVALSSVRIVQISVERLSVVSWTQMEDVVVLVSYIARDSGYIEQLIINSDLFLAGATVCFSASTFNLRQQGCV